MAAVCLGAGKAIVSTPYAYARERLADGRGRIVEAGSSEALAGGLIALALNSTLRKEHGRLAYEHSRSMVWPEVGATYRQVFARVGVQDAVRPSFAIPAETVAA